MTLATGRHYLAIPGPSVLPERVLRAMQRPSPPIHGGPLHDMMPGLLSDLKDLAGTRHDVAIYIANGHGAWEASLSNIISPGDHVLVPRSGHFSDGWAEMAAALGAGVDTIDAGANRPFDPEAVARAIEDDTDHLIKAVLAVQVDTSTSVRNDIQALGRAMSATGHPALLMVDSIACFACDRLEMDAWGVDVMVTASQKGLMCPPGLGFVFFNDRAARAREAARATTHYWDWRRRVAPEGFYQYFDGTAPTHHLFALREALTMIGEEGREAIWRRHEILTRAIWAAVERWGEGGPLRLNIEDASHRSHAVTTVITGGDLAGRLCEWCEDKAGLTLGIGLGFEPMEQAFRIGHMGFMNAHMILGLIATIEAGLRATGIDHAPGGIDAATRLIAEGA